MVLLVKPLCDPCAPLNTVVNDLFALHTRIQRPKPSKLSSKPSARTVQPAFSQRSSPEGVRLEVELPGVAKEDVKIELKDNKLTVAGSRFGDDMAPSPPEREEEAYSAEEHEKVETEKENSVPKRAVETMYELKIRLGTKVDENAVKAESYSNGILVVSIPFKKMETRTVKVA